MITIHHGWIRNPHPNPVPWDTVDQLDQIRGPASLANHPGVMCSNDRRRASLSLLLAHRHRPLHHHHHHEFAIRHLRHPFACQDPPYSLLSLPTIIQCIHQNPARQLLCSCLTPLCPREESPIRHKSTRGRRIVPYQYIGRHPLALIHPEPAHQNSGAKSLLIMRDQMHYHRVEPHWFFPTTA